MTGELFSRVGRQTNEAPPKHEMTRRWRFTATVYHTLTLSSRRTRHFMQALTTTPGTEYELSAKQACTPCNSETNRAQPPEERMGPRLHRESTHRIIRSLAKGSAARQPEGLVDAMPSLRSSSAPWRYAIMFEPPHALPLPFT